MAPISLRVNDYKPTGPPSSEPTPTLPAPRLLPLFLCCPYSGYNSLQTCQAWALYGMGPTSSTSFKSMVKCHHLREAMSALWMGLSFLICKWRELNQMISLRAFQSNIL